MIDINYSLRIAYTTALAAVKASGTGVYYQNAPSIPVENQYIIIQGINSNDASTSGSCDITTSVTLALHTFSDIVNSGLSADILARDVLNAIYPYPGATLTLDGAQMVSTEMTGDVTQTFAMSNGRNYISRFLTFKHFIFQTSDIS